jgi:RNA-directed DNA polymerase
MHHMRERGLELSEEKTLITHIAQGFDFLGWNFRTYKGKLLIKPSKKSQQNVLEKIRQVIDSNKAKAQDELIVKLNPIIRGWCTYHQGTVAKKLFSRMGHEIFKPLWRWACRRHPNKGLRWIKERYWKSEGNRRWVFKDTQTLLQAGGDTKIISHIPLKLDMNPYTDWRYFYLRKLKLRINRNLRTARKQNASKTGESSKDAHLCGA